MIKYIDLALLVSSVVSVAKEPNANAAKEQMDIYIKQYGLPRILKETSKQINKNTPIQIDKMSSITSTTSINNTFLYNYYVDSFKAKQFYVDILGKELSQDKVKAILNHKDFSAFVNKFMWASNVIQSCYDPAISSMLNAGAEIHHRYKNKDGIPIIDYSIANSDCINPPSREGVYKEFSYIFE